MPTYDDTRYTYEQALLHYDGLLSYPALSGSQGGPSADLIDLDHFQPVVSGNQPAVTDITYEQPGITYDEPVFQYEFLDTNFVTYTLHALRTMLGNQPGPTGAMSWRWAPYVWGRYRTSISNRPEDSQYVSRVQPDDHDIRYRPNVGDEHDDPDEEIVYRERAPRPYTHPDDLDEPK